MILVDTSVLIDFLKGAKNAKADIFDKALKQKQPYGISAYTYQEVLQGAIDEREYNKLNDYLSTQKIYFLHENAATYEKAARLFFTLRRGGITPRSTVDILIALTAIEFDLFLLHNDKDFDVFEKKISVLKILTKLN